MVYCDAEELKWLPYVKTWLSEVCGEKMRDDTKEFLFDLFERFVESGLRFVNKKCTQAIAQVRTCVNQYD